MDFNDSLWKPFKLDAATKTIWLTHQMPLFPIESIGVSIPPLKNTTPLLSCQAPQICKLSKPIPLNIRERSPLKHGFFRETQKY